MNRLRPDVEEWVQKYLHTFRTPTKKSTVFGYGGRSRRERPGEKVLWAPDGTIIRVIENPGGGTQIEEPDRLHAVIRPETVRRQGGVHL